MIVDDNTKGREVKEFPEKMERAVRQNAKEA
jgi:hypothetical protein